MTLTLPPRVQREIEQEKWADQRAEYRALVGRLLDFDDPVCREWAPVLQRLDPALRLGRARPQAYEPGLSVIPNFYHWVRENVGAPLTVQAITGPDGVSFSEPDSGLLERLKANDLHDPRIFAALIGQQAAREAELERERDRERADFNVETMERVKAVTETSVSMSGKWSQNASPTGKRGRKL